MKPREMLKGKMIDMSDLSEFSKSCKAKGKKIVFTAGSWDMLHVGQMRYLTEAKRLGDVLVVGVNSNESIRSVKGINKPILDEWIRAESLTFLRCVDFVTVIPTPSCQPALEILKPDFFVSVKEDWAKDVKDSKEYKTVTENGGEVVIIERQSPFVSTTSIVERMIGGHFAEIFEKYISRQEDPIKERFDKSE